MIYQLPNGKIVQLSIAQYLDLTDEDIHYMTNNNFGDYPPSPWVGSTLNRKSKKSEVEFIEPLNSDIDYTPESEELTDHTPLTADNIIIIDEEFSEIIDDDLE